MGGGGKRAKKTKVQLIQKFTSIQYLATISSSFFFQSFRKKNSPVLRF